MRLRRAVACSERCTSTGRAKLTTAFPAAPRLRSDIRRALLEADVSLPVVRAFVKSVEEKAAGVEVVKGVTPGQQLIKVVYDELRALMGSEAAGEGRRVCSFFPAQCSTSPGRQKQRLAWCRCPGVLGPCLQASTRPEGPSSPPWC